MAKRELPAPELLRQLLRYEPDTGALYWLERGDELFAANGPRRSWNQRYAGKRADHRAPGSGGGGYANILIYNHAYRAHRVAWAIVTGAWPRQIDHINGVRMDNRWTNLREVTAAENHRNTARHPRNRSGVSGVRQRLDRGGRWLARIHISGKVVSLGTFDTFAEAKAARLAAEREYGFHPNHGRDPDRSNRAPTP